MKRAFYTFTFTPIEHDILSKPYNVTFLRPFSKEYGTKDHFYTVVKEIISTYDDDITNVELVSIRELAMNCIEFV
jgi:hypothetical protein